MESIIRLLTAPMRASAILANSEDQTIAAIGSVCLLITAGITYSAPFMLIAWVLSS